MTRFLRRAASVAALIALSLIVQPSLTLFAQTALYTTTLGAALAAPLQGTPSNTITLASGTNVAVGQGLTVDGEYMTIQSSTPVATRWNVVRGQSGTQAAAHANGQAVFFGATNNFYFDTRQPAGACVSTAQQATPRVVVSLSVSIYLCPPVSTLTGLTAASWGAIQIDGQPAPTGTRYTGWTYATAGAVTVQPGVQFEQVVADGV